MATVTRTETKREREWKGEEEEECKTLKQAQNKKIVTLGKQEVKRSNSSFQVTGLVLLTTLRAITVVLMM